MEGLAGAFLIGLVILIAYQIAMKNPTWSLPDLTKVGNVSDNWLKTGGKLLLLVGVAALLWWGSTTDMRPSDIGVLAQKHWLAVIIVWAMLAALIAHVDAIQWKSGLQWILGGVIFLILFGFSWWDLAWSPSDASQQIVLSARGKTGYIRVPLDKRLVPSGVGIRVHCVYGDGGIISYDPNRIGETCPTGNMPFVFITNETSDPNKVQIAFR